MRGHILMDSDAELEVTEQFVTLRSSSGGQPLVQSWHRHDADMLAAKYLDKLMGGGQPPALLACFVNQKR